MATDRQIEANRRNAKKSTGPQSPKGKAVSGQNARKHGVLSDVVVASNEDAEAFQELVTELNEMFSPQTRIEEELVDKLALAIWRGRRLAIAERALIEEGHRRAAASTAPPRLRSRADLLAAEGVLSLDDQLRIGRYQVMIDNQTMRTLTALRNEIALRDSTITLPPAVN